MYYNVDITFNDGITVQRQWDQDHLLTALLLLSSDQISEINISKTDQFDLDRRG